MTEYNKYWVISEVKTSPSKPQKYVSESRCFEDEKRALDWCDFVKSQNKNKKKNIYVVKVSDQMFCS